MTRSRMFDEAAAAPQAVARLPARARGLDPDRSRRLAKVTRTE